jgi:hypothetical protein
MRFELPDSQRGGCIGIVSCLRSYLDFAAPACRSFRAATRIAVIGLSAFILCGVMTSLRNAEGAESLNLRIGVLLPPDEPQGVSVREGVLLAQEQSSGASTGRVEVIIRGRVGQWGADAVEVARLITGELSFDAEGNRKVVLELLHGHDHRFERVNKAD